MRATTRAFLSGKVDIPYTNTGPNIFHGTTVLPHLPTVMEENHEKYQDNGFLGKESKPELPRHQRQLM
jgi:hypothetical protein